MYPYSLKKRFLSFQTSALGVIELAGTNVVPADRGPTFSVKIEVVPFVLVIPNTVPLITLGTVNTDPATFIVAIVYDDRG